MSFAIPYDILVIYKYIDLLDEIVDGQSTHKINGIAFRNPTENEYVPYNIIKYYNNFLIKNYKIHDIISWLQCARRFEKDYPKKFEKFIEGEIKHFGSFEQWIECLSETLSN